MYRPGAVSRPFLPLSSFSPVDRLMYAYRQAPGIPGKLVECHYVKKVEFSLFHDSSKEETRISVKPSDTGYVFRRPGQAHIHDFSEELLTF
jgi:hypothetical protein